MSSFANLKRQSSTDFSKLTKAVEAINTTTDSNTKDENLWRPAVDKSGNGFAIFRFLPAPPVDGDEGLPWVKVFSHGFQGPGGWLIDNCLTTKGKECPVCQHNSELWNSGIEANKDIVRKQKRKLNYIANVYIVSDPSNKENEGKVKLFKFGKKIFDKLTEAMNPQFADEKAINPFDLWEGANFKIKIRKVDGYQNYDKSEFDTPAPLLENDEQLEKIWKSEFSLIELVADKEFKSPEDLKKRLDKVLGLSGGVPVARTTVETLKEEARTAPKRQPVIEDTATSDTDEDDLSYFSKLALED